MEFRMLGPLELAGTAGPVSLAGAKQRALLALLLIHAREVVSVDRLVDSLWGDEPPRTAATSLQNLVAQLRRAIGADLLVTRAPGYVLDVAARQIDASRFERLLAEAPALPAEGRSAALAQALALWRGPALADVAFESFAQPEIQRLEELRLRALEGRIDADLERGLGAELIWELERLAREHPLRERLCALLLQALYRGGRQAEALQAYHATRRLLDDELGVEPGPALQAVYRSILRQDGALLPAVVTAEPGPSDALEAIARALRASRLVLVLGAAAAAEADDAHAPVLDELAARFDCPPPYATDLARVAQFVAVTHGLGPLYDELHDLHGGEAPAGAVEEAIADVASGLGAAGATWPLIVTTAFGDALERALNDAGVPFDVVAYVAHGPDRGRFVHLPPSGGARLVDVPNAYAGLSSARTVVLKIHGRLDRSATREWESYAVSEDDHIEYLAQVDVANVLPVTIAALLRRSHFLFLGYSLREWTLRVFLQRVFGHDELRYRSWAVAAAPDELEQKLWARRGIDTLVAPPDRFVAALAARMTAAQAL